MENIYIGWIPCITGRLLFQHQKCGYRKSIKEIIINHEESSEAEHDNVRNIFVCSSMNLKDLNTDRDGKWTFIICGRLIDKNSNMDGDVFILPSEIYSKDTFWENKKNQIRGIYKKTLIGDKIDELFTSYKSSLSSYKHPEFYKIKFSIDRSGFCELSTYDTELDEKQKNVIVRQGFYYLKYSLHKHQHHDEENDSLTTIHEKPKNRDEIGLLLINDLKKSLVDLKRNYVSYNCEMIHSAIGITGYAKSLIESCKNKRYLSDCEYERQIKYFDNLSLSMQITLESIQAKLTLKQIAWDKARASVLFIFSLVMPLVVIFNNGINTYINEHYPENYAHISKILSSLLVPYSNLVFVLTFLFVFLFYKFVYAYNQLSIIKYIWITSKWIDNFNHDIIKSWMLAILIYIIAALLIFYSASYFFVF